MRHLLCILVTACTLVGTTVGIGATQEACTQPVVPTTVIAGAQAAAQTAATVVSDAQAAWPVVKVLLPPADQAAAQDAFDKSVFASNHAILALNDAISVAIAANNANPDLTTLLSVLGDAVAQVVAVVQEFQSKAPGAKAHAVTAGGVDAVADMQSAVARLRAVKK